MEQSSLYEYMVEVNLPLPFNKEFISLIPNQREVVNKLMSERIISSYAVSLEDGKLWTTIFAESVDEVTDILMEFPIINHIDYKISKLVFHNNVSLTLPQFSLN
ncbi:MAG: hypothetical protein IPL53_10495 [Ignavibacteria bacterium]|nr:hypothetical protein [Ignavibacteria bacterium]